MVNARFLVIAHVVVNYTQVDVGEELASNISDFLMLSVELNGILKVTGVLLSHLHVINTNAIVCEGLSVNVTNGTTNLEELLVFSDGLLVFTEIVE